MKYLIYIIVTIFLQQTEMIIFNFHKGSDISNFRIVNDGVMGGLSSSEIELNDDGLGVFRGSVSLENNGGFAMVQYDCSIENVKAYTHIILKIKGDGKVYQFRLKDSRNNYYSYVQNFKTSGKFETIELALKDFYPAFRGRKLTMNNFDQNNVMEIAILIGNKKKEDFRLEIDEIALN